MTTTKQTIGSLVLAAGCMLSGSALAHGDGDGSADIERAIAAVRQATLPFNDVNAATDAGYRPAFGCVAQPGQGGMGIHYLHDSYPGDALLDPLKPEALMYEPDSHGKLRLVGVEYIVFQDSWDALHPQPPMLFGHPFHLVRAPNRYGVPAFYELHLWVWKQNRNGIFNDWNPAVRCP